MLHSSVVCGGGQELLDARLCNVVLSVQRAPVGQSYTLTQQQCLIQLKYDASPCYGNLRYMCVNSDQYGSIWSRQGCVGVNVHTYVFGVCVCVCVCMCVCVCVCVRVRVCV